MFESDRDTRMRCMFARKQRFVANVAHDFADFVRRTLLDNTKCRNDVVNEVRRLASASP